MTDFGKLIVFKPVSDGYVYRRPNRWLFGVQEHLLVSDDQKTAIMATVNTSTPLIFWIIGIAWILQSALLGTALSLLAHRSGYYTAGLTGMIAVVAMILSIYPAFVISRSLLLHRLGPILAGSPRTSHRITALEERQAFQSIIVPISPTRRKIVSIASAVTIAATVGVIISRAVDIYEPNQPKLLALWLANANLQGLLSIVTIVAFVAVIVTFGRSPKPD